MFVVELETSAEPPEVGGYADQKNDEAKQSQSQSQAEDARSDAGDLRHALRHNEGDDRVTELETMIAEMARLKQARADTYLAHSEADKAYTEGSKRLTDALIAAGGWKEDQVIKLQSGGEAKIGHFRRTDDGTLMAACYDRTGNGAWSKRARLLVTLRTPAKETA
jgi:hypothetical protein